MVLILENEAEKAYISKLTNATLNVKVISTLHAYAHLNYKFTTNVKEFFLIIRSLWICFWLSLRNNFADITISAVEPERHLYLLWLPFIRVNYILHTVPNTAFSWITTFTCNKKLGDRKKIIAVSAFIKSVVTHNWKIIPKLQQAIPVIHNCLVTEHVQSFTATKENITKNILTVGRVDANKNPLTWLETAKTLTQAFPDVTFTWVGNGALLNEYMLKTADNPRINFVGLQADPSVFYHKAYTYYQPSYIESHGIAVVEAMYFGLPCVVSSTGGLPESVKENFNGILVDPATYKEHIDALTKLLSNAELHTNYSLNSRLRFEQNFTYDAFKLKMDQIYKN